MPEYKPKIFIAGDSWGCGEWDSQDHIHKVYHKGLEQYFSDAGFSVSNTSVGSSSNNSAINRLSNALEAHYSTGDLVLYIQTDPLRDLRPYTTLTQEVINHHGVISLRNSLLQAAYEQLQTTAIRVKCKILVIGGKADLYLPGFDNLKNVVPLIESWVHLLVGHMPEYQRLFPQWTTSDYNIMNINLPVISGDLLKKIIDEVYHSEKCWKMFREPIFHPDGCHPNRDGHKILFDHIIKKLNI
jgi:hypothetical protein